MEKRLPFPYQLLKKHFLAKSVKDIDYEELLWTDEWLSFREEIKTRDNDTRASCGLSQFRKMSDDEFSLVLAKSGYGKYFNLAEGKYEDSPAEMSLKRNEEYPSDTVFDSSVKIEVHHKYYIWNNVPWEYDLDVLTTLCRKCHEVVHQIPMIVYKDISLDEAIVLEACGRCGGKGYLPEFYHVRNGICFACGGIGGHPRDFCRNLHKEQQFNGN